MWFLQKPSTLVGVLHLTTYYNPLFLSLAAFPCNVGSHLATPLLTSSLFFLLLHHTPFICLPDIRDTKAVRPQQRARSATHLPLPIICSPGDKNVEEIKGSPSYWKPWITSNKWNFKITETDNFTQNEQHGWTVMLCKLFQQKNVILLLLLWLISTQTNLVMMEILQTSNTTLNQRPQHLLKARLVKVRVLSGAPSVSPRISVMRTHKHTNLSQPCSGCSLWRCRDGDTLPTAGADGFAIADVN